jgi:hypothetical protein
MRLSLALAATLAAMPAAANDFMPAIQSFLESEISPWSADPRLAQAILAQNAMTAGYTQADIDGLDQTWRAEVGSADSVLIRSVLDHGASSILREWVDTAGGTITEVFVMDARGLNVASSALTSDYWQGDEEKFTETYPKGPGAVHISEVEFDESTQTYQAQVSISLVDPATGAAVGAMTVGLNADRLF